MRYIGSKTRVLDFIDNTIKNTYGNYNNAIIGDLFSGTACVGEMFKKNGAQVISNDYMYFSYALQIAKIKANDIPSGKYGYQETLDILNELPGIEGFFFKEYTLEGSGTRNYFSPKNAKKIDAICMFLSDQLKSHELTEDEYYFYKASLIDAITKVSNTSGTYGAFLKIDDNRKFKPIELHPIKPHNNGKQNECYCEDIKDVILHTAGNILYLDPPYNNRQYPPYYHILETATLYDNPSIYGKTGRRHYEDKMSLLCMKDKAISAMSSIVGSAFYKHIYISYSTDGIMPYEDLCNNLSQYGNVSIFFKPYRRYKSNSNGNIEENGKLKELIIYVEKR